MRYYMINSSDIPQECLLQSALQGISILQVVPILMGYNPNCNQQHCNYDCCNFAGNCPTLPTACYHYYHHPGLTPAAIAGIVIAALVFVGLIILAIYCCKRYRDRHYHPHPPPPPPVSNEVMIIRERPAYQPYGQRNVDYY